MHHVLDRVGMKNFPSTNYTPKLITSRQHNVVPDASLVSEITHVALAFMTPAVFNQPDPATASFPLFTTVDAIRLKFAVGTKVMIAIGGWGDTQGFSVGAATDQSRKLFAQNIKQMVANTGADGNIRGFSNLVVFLMVL